MVTDGVVYANHMCSARLILHVHRAGSIEREPSVAGVAATNGHTSRAWRGDAQQNVAFGRLKDVIGIVVGINQPTLFVSTIGRPCSAGAVATLGTCGRHGIKSTHADHDAAVDRLRPGELYVTDETIGLVGDLSIVGKGDKARHANGDDDAEQYQTDQQFNERQATLKTPCRLAMCCCDVHRPYSKLCF